MEQALMPESHSEILQRKEVVFTGRLASMTRAEAAALVRAHGGLYASRVSRRSTFLVVGQDGWPLDKAGRLTNKLRKARTLQRVGHAIAVLTEEGFLAHLGMDTQAGSRRLHTIAQLSQLLKVPGNRLRVWLRAGLIQAVETKDGVPQFDYGQVVSARTLCELTEAGVTTDRLRRSLAQLRKWMGDAELPLLQLATLEKTGPLLVRLTDGLAEPTGQRHFEFDPSNDHSPLALPQTSKTTDQWFEEACEAEDSGCFDDAIDAYRQALWLGGQSPMLCFNLANVLYASGQKERAVERYYQAVELDRHFAQGWNNLGVVLSELGKTAEGQVAFERALSIDPQYNDARYNLADLLDGNGQQAGAGSHWKAYLSQDQQSIWAKHARGRLAAISQR
jgi:tetratricopeptide (TPR) repeat protein